MKTTELEYSRLAINADGQIREAATDLESVEEMVLGEIFAKNPELKDMVENFRRIWINVDFTRDHERIFNWAVEAANMIPERYAESFTQIK